SSDTAPSRSRDQTKSPEADNHRPLLKQNDPDAVHPQGQLRSAAQHGIPGALARHALRAAGEVNVWARAADLGAAAAAGGRGANAAMSLQERHANRYQVKTGASFVIAGRGAGTGGNGEKDYNRGVNRAPFIVRLEMARDGLCTF